MRDKTSGDGVVPIVPDEARTFGMDSLFRQFGSTHLKVKNTNPRMLIKLCSTGRVKVEYFSKRALMKLELSGWLALATSYSNHKLTMVPFYIYYSMFGFQRVHDLAWAAGDSRARISSWRNIRQNNT